MAKVEQHIRAQDECSFLETIFESGNKRLLLNIDLKCGWANTSVFSIDRKDKVSGATSEVYTEAKSLIKVVADDLHRPIQYEFCTLFPSMISWAMDSEKGAKIFNWDKIDPNYHKFVFRAEKTFYPVEV